MRQLIDEDGRASGTKTMFSIVTIAIVTKMLVAGVSYGPLVVAVDGFDWTGAAALWAAAGGTLVGRQHVKRARGAGS